jgi:hypothetical protein
MHMIGHQHVSVDSHLVLLGRFAQAGKEIHIIFRLAEDCLAINATLDQVMRLVGNDESGQASHGRKGLSDDVRILSNNSTLTLFDLP